jgi:DNA polymerase-3 subunit delta
MIIDTLFYPGKKIMPTYLYWGEEEFAIELAVKKLRNKILDPDWATFNHKKLDKPELRTLNEALNTLPMGFGDVLIEVRNLNIFSKKSRKKDTEEDTSTPASSDRDVKELLELIPELPDRINLLFVVEFPRNSKKKIDKTLKTTKTFIKHAVIQQFDSFKSWDEKKVTDWIIDAAREMNVKIEQQAAKALFENTGPELRKLNSELNKLATYAGEGKTIKKEHVMLLCSGFDNVFNLLEKWVYGNTHDALKELEKILDKDHPVKLIASLQTLLTQWLHIKLELKYGNTSTQLPQKLGIHPFVIKNAIYKIKHIPEERLSHLREQLTQYENKIKTGQLKAELALEILMTL